MATNRINRVGQKQKKRSRGRPALPKLGDVDSIVEAIHSAEDKMDYEVVVKLNSYYKTLRDIAEAKGKFGNVGVKDQVKAIEYCITRAESFLDDYYSKDESGIADNNESNSDEKESAFAPLISLVANDND